MKTINIGARIIGLGHPVFIIAEIGSNHDASLAKAKELVHAAKEAGADCTKFQSWTPEGLYNSPSDLLRKLTVSDSWHFELNELAKKIGIIFMSTPFDEQRAKFLNDLGVPAFKIASGDITHIPLIKTVASFKKPVIVATGLSYLEEVERAVNAVTSCGNDSIALLHCVSNYPTNPSDSNIRAMVTMKDKFNLPVGYSDHTISFAVPLGAVALGASVIEKHFTYDQKASGPDHPHSLDVAEFTRMVKEIRDLEKALGTGEKKPAKSEEGERTGARRGLYAKTAIKAGETLTEEKIKIVRTFAGLSPADLSKVVGRKTKSDINENDPITLDKLS